MSIRHKPEDWLKMMQDGMDDLALAGFLLADLTHYRSGSSYEESDTKAVLALITAVRLNALATTQPRHGGT